MDLGIAGKSALVIGGSDGLGLACSETLAAEGVHLAIFARNCERLDSIATGQSAKHRVPVLGFAGDITGGWMCPAARCIAAEKRRH